MTEIDTAIRLAVAGIAGMAVGLEREWSGHASGPAARFAGVRTFFLLGGLGGLAGWLLEAADPLVSAALLAAAGALIVSAYVSAARRGGESIDGTTEAAAILVLGIGLLAGMGSLALASGAAAVVMLVLREKSTIHGFLSRIGEEEMRAALQFAVLALVVLPLLPEGPIGPFGGIKPRALWIVVLIFSGLNFAGYLARRALGDARGYPVMGALGGLVSSTAVTLGFARQSRRERVGSAALAIGTIAAWTVLVLRILTVILVLNAALLPGVALGLAPGFLVGVVLVVVSLRRNPSTETRPQASENRNPLQLLSAIKMAIAFQVVLSLLALLSGRFGSAGVLASAAFLGLTDMDALTFGMSRLAEAPALVAVAAQAVVLGVAVNSAFKTGLAIVLGSPEYRRAAVPRMLFLTAAGVAGIWLVARVFPPI
ncbi:MAG TPA: MgtC/SapB family protein [Gemmatimonadales bacterium]|nr:MgtC/SapB family protein [Gemmatimonadales bacterium]